MLWNAILIIFVSNSKLSGLRNEEWILETAALNFSEIESESYLQRKWEWVIAQSVWLLLLKLFAALHCCSAGPHETVLRWSITIVWCSSAVLSCDFWYYNVCFVLPMHWSQQLSLQGVPVMNLNLVGGAPVTGNPFWTSARIVIIIMNFVNH